MTVTSKTVFISTETIEELINAIDFMIEDSLEESHITEELTELVNAMNYFDNILIRIDPE